MPLQPSSHAPRCLFVLCGHQPLSTLNTLIISICPAAWVALSLAIMTDKRPAVYLSAILSIRQVLELSLYLRLECEDRPPLMV